MQNISSISGEAELSFISIPVSLELINPLKNPVYDGQYTLKKLSLSPSLYIYIYKYIDRYLSIYIYKYIDRYLSLYIYIYVDVIALFIK